MKSLINTLITLTVLAVMSLLSLSGLMLVNEEFFNNERTGIISLLWLVMIIFIAVKVVKGTD